MRAHFTDSYSQFKTKDNSLANVLLTLITQSYTKHN